MSANIDILIGAQEEASGVIGGVVKRLADLEGSSTSLLTKGLAPLQDMLMTGLKVAATATTAAIGGLVAGIATSVGKAEDMQQSVADISAAMGASSEETAKLKGLIQDLGLDPKLKVDATQAAEAIGNLGTAGLSVDQILGGAARSTVLLANATGADFASAANMATDVMSLWGIKADDLSKAVNGITATTVASKFTINDYALALANGGGVASTVGVSFDDFNATIAAISPFFDSGAKAGVSFKVFLQRLVPQSNAAADAMRDLGLFTGMTEKEFKKTQAKIEDYRLELSKLDPTAKNYQERAQKLTDKIQILQSSLKDGSNAFYDANGSMKSMTEISGILNKALSGLSEEQKNAALTTIFGTDAQIAAAAIAKKTATEFQALKDTMGKTDAEEAAAKRMDTFKGSLEILAGVFDTVQMAIGDKFLPLLTDLIKRFTEFVQGVAPAVIDWAGVFADQLGALINYIIVLVQEGDTANDWLTHMNPAIRGVVEGILAFYNSAKSMIDTIRNFIAPITDAITKFVSWKDVLIAVGLVAATILVPAIASIAVPLAAAIALFSAAVAGSAYLRNAWETNFGGIRTLVGGAIDYLNERFGLLFAVVRDYAGGALKEIMAWATGTQTSFKNLSFIWETAKSTITLFFQDITRYVQNNLPSWLATLSSWGAAAWQWIASAITPALAKLGEWGAAIGNWIVTNTPAFLAKLGTWGAAAWQWIANATAPALAKLGEWGAAIWNWIVVNTPGFLAKLGEWGTAAWQWIANAIGPAVSQMGVYAGALWTWITNNYQTWLVKLGAWGISLWQWIVAATPTVLITLGAWLTGLGTWVSNNYPVWLAKLGTLGMALWQWIVAVTPTVLANLGTLLVNIGTWVAQQIPGLIAKFLTWSTALYKWIGDAVPLALQALGGWVETMLRWMSSGGEGNSKLLSMFGTLLYTVNEALGKIGLALVKLAGQIALDLIIALAQGLLNLAGININLWKLKDEFVNTMSDVAEPIKNHFWSVASDIMGKIGEGMSSGASAAAGKINEVWGAVVNEFNVVKDNVKNHFFSVSQQVVLALRDGLNAVKNDPVGAINGVLTSLGGALDDQANTGGLKGKMAALGSGAVYALRDGINAVAKDPAGALSTVMQNLTTALNNLTNVGGDMYNHFKSKASEVMGAMWIGLSSAGQGGVGAIALAWNSVIDWVNSKFDQGGGIFNHLYTKAKEVGGFMMQGLKDGIMNMLTSVTESIWNVATNIVETLRSKLGIGSPSKVLRELAQFAMQGLDLGLKDLIDAPIQTIKGVAGAMVGAGQSLMQNLADGVNSMANAPASALASAVSGGGDSGGQVTNNTRTNNFTFNAPTSGGGRNDEQMTSLINTVSAIYAS